MKLELPQRVDAVRTLGRHAVRSYPLIQTSLARTGAKDLPRPPHRPGERTPPSGSGWCGKAGPARNRWRPPPQGPKPAPPQPARRFPTVNRRARLDRSRGRFGGASRPCLLRAAFRRSSNEGSSRRSGPPVSWLMLAPGNITCRKAGACYRRGVQVSRTLGRFSGRNEAWRGADSHALNRPAAGTPCSKPGEPGGDAFDDGGLAAFVE